MDNWMHSSSDKSYAFRYFKIRLNRFWLKKISCRNFVKTTIWKSIPRGNLYKSMQLLKRLISCSSNIWWAEMKGFSHFSSTFTLILDVKYHLNWKIITKYVKITIAKILTCIKTCCLLLLLFIAVKGTWSHSLRSSLQTT